MTRLVKLEIVEGYEEYFVEVYMNVFSEILKSPGCNTVKLVRDIHSKHIFFTVSEWDTEEDLNNYRASSLFREIWAKLKPHFANKAEVWSVEELSRKV